MCEDPRLIIIPQTTVHHWARVLNYPRHNTASRGYFSGEHRPAGYQVHPVVLRYTAGVNLCVCVCVCVCVFVWVGPFYLVVWQMYALQLRTSSNPDNRLQTTAIRFSYIGLYLKRPQTV